MVSIFVQITIYIMCDLFSESVVFSDPLFDTPNENNLTREQLYSESIRRHILLWNKVKELNLSDLSEILVLYEYVVYFSFFSLV